MYVPHLPRPTLRGVPCVTPRPQKTAPPSFYAPTLSRFVSRLLFPCCFLPACPPSSPPPIHTQVYAAYPSYIPGWLVLDLYAFFAFIGIIDNPFSVYAKLVGLKKGGENLK